MSQPKGGFRPLAVKSFTKEPIMIAHRRTWFYRLAGQDFARKISFKMPVTAQKVRDALRQMFGGRHFELWSH